MCELLTQADNMMRGLIGCIVCLLCVGPILLIVGIVVLVAPNDRADRVAKFNDAVSQFNNDGGMAFKVEKWSGDVAAGTQQFGTSIIKKIVDVKGNTEDVNTGNTVFAQASVSSSAVGSSISYKMNPGPFYTAGDVQTVMDKSISIQCSSSACSRDCSDSTDRYCSSSSLDSECKRRHGSGAKFVGSGCRGSRTCGTCDFTGYLSTYCSVATLLVSSPGGNDTWTRDPTKSSCYYPFGAADQIYSSTRPSTIKVQLRAGGDPFLALQELTDGTGDFGLTRAQQTAIAITLIVFGCVFIACVVGPIFLFSKRRSEANGAAYPPSEMTQQPPTQQYQHNEPQPYGQSPPQQPYEQPPQHYQHYGVAPQQQQQHQQPYGQLEPGPQPYGQDPYAQQPQTWHTNNDGPQV